MPRPPSPLGLPLVEVFLLVEQPRQRLSHWTQALAPFDDPGAPAIVTVDAHFDPTTNQAIFTARYAASAFDDGALARITDIATFVEIAVIPPHEMSDAERRRFVTERLARCTERVTEQKKLVAALIELVRRVRGPRASTTPPPSRTDTHRDADNPLLAVTARGTRREGAPVATSEPERTRPAGPRALGTREQVPQSTRDLARGSVGQAKLDRPPSEPNAVPEEQKRVVTEPIAIAAPSPPPPPAPSEPPLYTPPRRAPSPSPSRLSPNVVTRAGVHRANTVMMSPIETQRMLEAANATQPVPLVTEPLIDVLAGALADDPLPPPTSEPAEPGLIYARYLRGGRWVPIRIGALSLKGATLLAGALPRVDDRVDISLLYGNHRALVRGTVGKVSTRQEAAASGATAFTVGFELEETSRRQLTVLLTAARAAKVTLRPPPPRSTQRFPVEWPITLGTMRGAVRAEALDVSTDGMFVRPVNSLTLEANLTFTIVLDDASSPVSGHARVVRSISDLEARNAGLSPGYGVSILDMPAPDRERWNAFLSRIEQRAGKRVLIGASPARLAELQSGLVAAGYTATGGSDPGAIAQLVSTPALPFDAALIDAGWLALASSPEWVEAVFSARNVPCVTLHGDSRRARIAIDRLLAVA
jgi:hypothetical protein